MSAATRPSLGDIAAIIICTLAWSTTWYAITLQFGRVDPVVSIVYRFLLAAGLLFAWCALRREPVALTRAQHAAAFGMGLFTFTLDYAFVYWAEERVVSAVVAVIFASLAFTNLVVFRIAFRDRAPPLAWSAALLGLVGVAILSWGEIAAAETDARAGTGIALALAGVIGAAIGNAFARRGEAAQAPVAALTAWAMAHGAALLAAFAFATGRSWAFDPTWPYVLSLLHLAVFGSVVAFLLYYGLARRRGYASASYISALTPPIAMAISSGFEQRVWDVSAFIGLACVLAGQWLLLRARRA